MMKFDFELVRSSRRTLAIEIKRGGRIIVRAPISMSREKIESFINSKIGWIEKHLEKAKANAAPSLDTYTEEEIKELKAKAKETILPLVDYYANIVGVKYTGVKINRAKKRYGSCNSKNSLNFSCFLMLCPREAVEYVVVHELCHILEHNHSRKFYSHVERVLPDYKAREKLLGEIG